MQKLIISTCGTSILSNDASPVVRKLLTDNANICNESDLPEASRRTLQAHVSSSLAKLIATTDINQLTRQSAELNGVAGIYGGKLTGGKDHHILLATDTWLGEQGANAIETVLQNHGHSTEVRRVTDLRTDSIDDFRAALSEVVKWAYDTLPGYKEKGYEIVFNLVGGFKAVQGFMQTLGGLLADRCVYLFEGSNQLITLPRLPIKMDTESWVRDNLVEFRRMNSDLPVSTDAVQPVPELLLFSIEGQSTLSEWGTMVWREVKEGIYSQKVQPSLSDRVVFGKDFLQSVADLDSKRTAMINDRMDSLACYFEKKDKPNPKMLDFKIIQGPSVKGSTFEMDAWRDGSAKRLFGHFNPENKQEFIVDRLDAALH